MLIIFILLSFFELVIRLLVFKFMIGILEICWAYTFKITPSIQILIPLGYQAQDAYVSSAWAKPRSSMTGISIYGVIPHFIPEMWQTGEMSFLCGIASASPITLHVVVGLHCCVGEWHLNFVWILILLDSHLSCLGG